MAGVQKEHGYGALFIHTFLLLQTLVLQSGPSILVQAQDACSQDSLLNSIACGSMVQSSCDPAGTTEDPNLGSLLFRGGSSLLADIGSGGITTNDAYGCCARCAQLPDCDAWQFLPGPGSKNCYFINSDLCSSIGVPPSERVEIPDGFCADCTFGSGANLAQGRCSDGVIGQVATPKCKSLVTVTPPGAECVAHIPDASAVYDGDSPQPSLNLRVIDSSGNPLTDLAVGTESTLYDYSLTASSGYAVSGACNGKIQVVPVALPDQPLSCNTVTLQATDGCSVDPPNVETVYGDTYPSVFPLDFGIDNSPTSLLAGQSYPYTVSVTNCGFSRNSCRGSINVVADTIPAPACKSTSTVPATANCAATRPDPVALYTGTFPLAGPLTIFITRDGTTMPEGATLSVGTYQYSLITSSSCSATSAACTGTIIVKDSEPLDKSQITCPGVSSILPSSAKTAAAAFTATYLGGSSKANGCPVTLTVATNPSGSAVTCDWCKKGGQHEAPPCRATVSGNKLTVTETGGSGAHISWTMKASDGLKTETKTCGVCVENPGKGGVCKASWLPGTPAPCS